MAAIAIDISRLRQKGGDIGSPKIQEMLHSVQHRTAGVADSLQLLSHDLHPNVLQRVGLVAALKAHCAEVEHQQQVHVMFHVEGVAEPPGRLVALSLFGIAQEALRNTARHGHARHATVSLVREETQLTMRVADDGGGFDVSAVCLNGGLGLVSMEERARLVRGEFFIRSSPGHGTEIEVRVPIDVVNHAHE